MKTLQVSDELFEKLKDFVVDPFEDTPEVILDRVMDIVGKAKRKWSPLCQAAVASEAKPFEDVGNEHSEDLRYRPADEVAAVD